MQTIGISHQPPVLCSKGEMIYVKFLTFVNGSVLLESFYGFLAGVKCADLSVFGLRTRSLEIANIWGRVFVVQKVFLNDPSIIFFNVFWTNCCAYKITTKFLKYRILSRIKKLKIF